MSSPATDRRIFAIISHPDAGKTTLTEKRLLKGGAIHLAGQVEAISCEVIAAAAQQSAELRG